MTIVLLERMDKAMVEKNLKKLKAKKRRVMNGFNTGTRDMKLKTAYRRKKRWSAEDADHFLFTITTAGRFELPWRKRQPT